MKDYYALLHVRPDASSAHIDAAYRRLMSKHHPNVRATPQALDKMRELNEAWRVLSDAGQRAAYDRARATGLPFQAPDAFSLSRSTPPTPSIVEFGAGRPRGNPCLVGAGVLLVLVFTIGILLWGLNEQYDLRNVVGDWQTQLGALLPVGATEAASVAQGEVTPTPDPRCRTGCETPPPGCVVKGDIEPDGQRYFYLPNDGGYNQIRLNTAAGDRWFCTSTDAQTAGWTRKAPTATPTMPPPPEFFTSPVSRRALIVCGGDTALHQGPGADFPAVSQAPNGTRLVITGVNGDWSVVTVEGGQAFALTEYLCTPTRSPTRASSPGAPAAGTPTANALAMSAPTKYPAPRLVTPSNGAKYWCSRDLILEWAFDGQLGADEFFLVESKAQEREQWAALADWTKERSIPLHPVRGGGTCDAFWWANTGVYQWRVTVVSGNKETPALLSPSSAIQTINYAR